MKPALRFTSLFNEGHIAGGANLNGLPKMTLLQIDAFIKDDEESNLC